MLEVPEGCPVMCSAEKIMSEEKKGRQRMVLWEKYDTIMRRKKSQMVKIKLKYLVS